MIRRNKIFTIILIALLAISCMSCALLGRKVKRQKMQITDAEQLIEWQHQLIEKLSAMDAVHCSVTFEIKNTAVMGSIKNGDITQIADATATYMRGELLKQTSDSICKK